MFICAAWKKSTEGPIHASRTLVLRCDEPEGHEGRHCDNVLLVSFDDKDVEEESKPRNILPQILDEFQRHRAEGHSVHP